MANDDRTNAVARAIREEILRQYRDDERRKCPAGAPFYEEEVSPLLIAEAALKVADAFRKD